MMHQASFLALHYERESHVKGSVAKRDGSIADNFIMFW